MEITAVFNNVKFRVDVGKLEDDTKDFIKKMEDRGFLFTYYQANDKGIKTMPTGGVTQGSIKNPTFEIDGIKPKLIK